MDNRPPFLRLRLQRKTAAPKKPNKKPEKQSFITQPLAGLVWKRCSGIGGQCTRQVVGTFIFHVRELIELDEDRLKTKLKWNVAFPRNMHGIKNFSASLTDEPSRWTGMSLMPHMAVDDFQKNDLIAAASLVKTYIH